MVNSELQLGYRTNGSKESLISIIIPSFNREFSLPVAIESVLKQYESNWELIIVDDGSTDNTKEVVNLYLTDSRIKYFYQENSGVAAARNKGADMSRGDHLIFLDSDDTLFPGLIARLNEVNFIEYDLICWPVRKIIDGKTSLWKPQKLQKIYNNITASFLAGSISYKREVFMKAGKFDTKMSFGENYESGLRISQRKDLKIQLLQQAYLEYTLNQKKRTSNSLINRLNSFYHQYQKHKDLYERDKSSYSKINYLLGFVHQKMEMRSEAKRYYWSSFLIDPLNWKAFLRYIHINLTRS